MRILLALLTFFFLFDLAYAQNGAPPISAPTVEIEVHQLPLAIKSAPFNAQKATNAYLARVSGEARLRSDSYFESGYVLQVVDAVYVIGVMGLFLWLGISTRLRDFSQSLTSSRFWQLPVYFVPFFAISTLAMFPLVVYEGYFRENAYGLSNQNFGQWFWGYAIQIAIFLVILTIAVTLLYAGIRRAPKSWWIGGTALTILLIAIVMLIYPVFLAPIFNHYQSLPDSPIKREILSMARANGVPASDVYQYDASRQSNRISANVSGLFGTTRISLTDNLLNHGSLREVKAVVGHEIGHFVMNHTIILLLWLSIIIGVGYWFTDRLYRLFVNRFTGKWSIKSIEDPAGLPLLYASFAFYLFLATPFMNTIIRTQESQADLFGVNAAREPDAFATVVLKLSNYRKLDPSPLEEMLFYNHPSGRSRIEMMMRWKAEHINDPDIKSGPVSPQ